MNEEDRERLIRIDTNVEQLLKSHQDHEGRLRRLEKFKNWLTGILSLIGSGLGIQHTINN